MEEKQELELTEKTESQEKNETEIGNPSVTARRKVKKNHSDIFWILGFGLLILCIAVVYYSQVISGFKDKPNAEEPISTHTSSRVLHLTPIPATDPQSSLPANPTENKTIKEEVPAEIEKPTLSAVTVVTPPPPVPNTPQQYGISAPAGEVNKELSLADRRNQAPMMGEPQNKTAAGAGSSRQHSYGREPAPLGKLDNLLTATQTEAARAEMMPDRNFLLAKGTFIDCILETKLDTTVPGMTACVIPQNVYSANGKVLLIEKGSRAVGEYKSAVENGLNRIFVLWTQIQTPKGVRVNLDSPSTDALGGAGMSGEVDYHWWARFGNALLFSLVQDGFDFAMTKQSENNGGVNYYQNSEDGMNEIIKEAMRQSGNIPPTLTKNQGERIGIFTARDIDFSNVYQLVPADDDKR